jgi:hypothetical protein
MKPDKHLHPFGDPNKSWRQRTRGGANRTSGRERRLRLEPLEQRHLLSVTLNGAFDGISDTGLRPPDPITAAGPDNLVALVNASVALFDKGGTQQELNSLATFFDTVAEDLSTPFDPWAVYDRYSDRFFVSAEEVESGEGADEANLLIGVSTSDFPDTLSSADWRWLAVDGTYDFGGVEVENLAYINYAKIATDADSVYIVGNYFYFDDSPSEGYAGVVITRLDKADALAGTVTVTAQVDVPAVFRTDPSAILQPAQSVGRAAGEPQLFVGADPENNGIDVYEFDDANNLTLVADDLFTPWTTFTGGAPQQGAGDTLDTLSDRLMNAVWRDDSLWTTHTIDVNGDATARWYEIDTAGGYAEIQAGDVNPGAGVNTFMPAINVNASGQMALTFTQSSDDQFADMMITGRQPGQPAGFTETPVVARSGLAGYNPSGEGEQRWGDYAGLALDPQDDHTFWAFGETAATTDAWATTFAQFEVGPMTRDELESPTNNSLSTATVLGSLPKITLRDLTIDDGDDVDYFQITAQDTGKLAINMFFQDALGDLDMRVEDADGNVVGIATSTTDDELLVIPVVGQQRYFLRVYGFLGATNVYDLEIENFAAPVPDAVVLDPFHDTGASNSDNVTSNEIARIFIEADLADFAAEGINILGPAEVAAGNPGAAVEVFVNGASVGYAAPMPGTNSTLFQFAFAPGDLKTTFIPVGGGGGLNFVKGAARIFDGQLVQQDGRSQLSSPLLLTLDTTAPVANTPDLLSSSDSGTSNTDDVTDMTQPAFGGTAEANRRVFVYANGVLVGQGVAGSDATDGVIGNGLGDWEVTVEPLDYGAYSIQTRVEDLAGNLSALSDSLTVVIDPYEPDDTIDTATVLGSEEKVTLRDLLLDDISDVDFFQITAQDTGKLIFNVFFEDALGDVDIQIQDSLGNVIASSSSVTDDEQITIPVVSQERYFLRVGLFDDPDGEGNYYDLEIENFAAPLVDNVDLPAKDRFDVLNDTGLSQFDNVTSRTTPEIILEADLDDFFLEGIGILTAAQAEAGLTPGAAVEVFVNGNSVGFAEPIAASGNTLFRYTFEPGELPVTDLDPEASFVADSGGWLHYVKGAVRIFDGQMDDAEVPQPDPATGRTQLSEPLELVVDTVAPAVSLPNLLASSDSGRFNGDNVTNITTPAFDGAAEHNAIIRVFAIDVTDPGNPGPAELVGQGRVGTDLTEDGFNQVGSWEVTIEPLDDHSNDPSPLTHYASYRIVTEVEDLAGNITRLGSEESLRIWIDAIAPNTPYLDLVDASDSGRSNYDDITNVNQPTVTVTADDTPLGDGNPFPNTIIYRIYDRPDPSQFGGGANNGEVLLVDSFVTNPNFTANGFFTEVLNTLADGVTTYTLLDGVHNLKLEVEDLAGNISEDFLLTVTIDTVAPPVSIIGIDPAATDTGIEDQPGTFVDRITSDTATGFVGWAEADAIVRLYADPASNNVIDNPAEYSLTVALPEDGNLAFPDGQWRTAFIRDLNDPNFFPLDGVREILVTAEDVAGNVNTLSDELGDADQTLDVFIDTRGPQVDEVSIAGHEDYDLFDPKPSEDGPTPLVYSLDIDFIDRPVRVDESAGRGPVFVYPAVNEILATTPGNYVLVGDANGIIPIASIEFLDHTVAGDVGRTTVRLNFYEPLPDDRFTLTVSDHIMDDAGNALDGESNAAEPQENPLFPSGDGEPGGDFVARFTVDSRPEIGVWAAGSVWVDTNGNFSFDPYNLDFTNRDITYVLAFTSDNVFNGNFAAAANGVADGFDKLAAYGRVGGQYRWLIDTDNDGVPNLDVLDPAYVNGLPVAGRFDGSTTNGDEVGLFTGTTWYFDTNHDYRVDKSLVSDLRGYAIVGDFDGDGFDDLATYVDDHFEFDLANGVLRGWDGHVDAVIDFGFIGVRERPVAADMNRDGIDDIGLWVPDRAGATPEEISEWYFLISEREIDNGDGEVALQANGSLVPALDHPFTPIPFGKDVYAKFGDEYAMPLVGNFDPPVTIDESVVSIGAAQLSATLVKTPTAVGARGEVDALPASDPSIDEWDTHWVEIWVNAADTNGVGVALAMADLAYNTDCFTPTVIEYGPAFTENQMGTIDDAAGVIRGLGASTSAADLGDGQYVLLARVQFAPATDDPGLPVSADARVESRSCDVALGETRVALADDLSAAVRLANPPATALRPFVYDLDDDGTVGLGDLSYFAAAYKHTVGASGVGYTYASDFDGDGVIGLGDLSYLAAAYGRDREGVVLTASGSGSQAAASAASAAVDAAMTEQTADGQADNKRLFAAWAQTPTRRIRLAQPSERLAKTLAVDWYFTENQ